MAITSGANSEPLIRRDEALRYRPLGKSGLMVSALSFGCMRLTEDQDLNTKLIAGAIDLGINYFETTRGYCGGQCQHRTAPGLQGKMHGIIVSGKAGIGPDSTAYGFFKEIERQLEILGLTHFKFYQVGWFSWGMMSHLIKRGGVLDAIRRAQDEGLVQRIGFTGHDTPENFIRCIETGVFDCITVPYSLLNRRYEPLIKRAGELGVGVVAMCPVAGGILAHESDKVKSALKLDMPTAAMALRFVLSNPNVSTACSGMNKMEHLVENVRTVREFDPEKAPSFEEVCEGLDRLREGLGDRVCTACGYCTPCPQGINIPYSLEMHRGWKCFGLDAGIRAAFTRFPVDQRPVSCNECGKCEEKCPNRIPVRVMFKEMVKAGLVPS